MIEDLRFGPAARFLMRSTPLPELIRYLLDQRYKSAYGFLEDFRLPAHIRGALNGSGLLSHDHGNFFMMERHEIRIGIIIGKPLNRDDGSESPVPLRRDLARFLEQCRPDPQGVRFYPAEGIPGVLTPGGIRRPLLIVVWAGESPPLERLLGRRAAPSPLEKWSKHLRTLQCAFSDSAEYETGSPPLTDEIDETGEIGEIGSDQASDAETIEATAAGTATVPERPTEKPSAQSPAVEAAPPPTVETGSPVTPPIMTALEKSWREIGLHIVGSQRGARRRRMLVRKRDNSIRLILQNIDTGIPLEKSAGFFKQLDDAENVVRAHRELFNSTSAELPPSFSLQIAEDYTFQALACRNRPLLWRSKSRRLYLFPDSRSGNANSDVASGSGRKGSRIIKGSLGSGDALLFFPEPLNVGEIGRLEKEFQKEGALSAPVIEGFLRARDQGKTLILRRF